LMTGEAVGGLQREVVVDVARGTRRRRGRHVRTDQRKARSAVIERRGVPSLRGMAFGAIGGRKCRARRRVNGIISLLPCRQMATRVSAISRLYLQIVVSVDMASSTLHVGVAIRQKKSGGAVIKLAVGPSGYSVAGRASCCGRWESCGHVIRYRATQCLRLVPIRRVAAHAVRGIQRVIIIYVAGQAGRRRR
jgi:hypothetical protein